jgi:DNA-binding MarR family transcriptional regulator
MTTDGLQANEALAWRGLHRIRQELMGHLGRNLMAKCGLSASEYELLVVLTEAPQRRMRFRDLCVRVGWDRSRLSRQLQRMEKRGFLTREDCPGDGRGVDVAVTPAGLSAIEAAAPIQLEAVRHCFVDVLTDQQLATFAEIAAAISAHFAVAHTRDDEIGR